MQKDWQKKALVGIFFAALLALCLVASLNSVSIGFKNSGNPEQMVLLQPTAEETSLKFSSHERLLIKAGENDANSGGDAGDSIAFATNITMGIYNGTLSDEDKDYYRFNVASGMIINVSMIPWNLSINFDLTLYSPESNPLAQDLKDAGLRETIIWSSSSSGNFTISILPATPSDIGNYTFSVTLVQQNDFLTESDAGNSFGDATPITPGAAGGTLVDTSDVFDFYKISIQRGQIISILLETENTTNLDLYLLDKESVQLDSSTKLTGVNETIYHAISLENNYIIQVVFVESSVGELIVDYNLTISINTQNDGNFGTDAGDNADDALLIIPLRDSKFKGRLVYNGDKLDFYKFDITEATNIIAVLLVDDLVNFDLKLYDLNKVLLYSSEEEYPGATEAITDVTLTNGTYYISVEFVNWEVGNPLTGTYTLNIGLLPIGDGNNNQHTAGEIIMMIISYGLLPIFLVVIIILLLYVFTDVKIPGVSNWLDRYLSKENKGETVKSLKYALRVRDEQISTLREEAIQKDAKRAKDLETIHRLEEDQKSKEKVITKLREENARLKKDLDNLSVVSEDLANIIDSTIRRQLAKDSKTTNKVKVSAITSLLWLPEERLINYLNSVKLLNERYIFDKNKNFILTREYAREIVRQSYWKRVGAMHLKKIKQVKIANLADDTNINIETLKGIIRELVERKEIPAPIHMDRESLLLSISEELITELAEVAQNTPIISLKELSESYDTTCESARVILEKIAEEEYTKGEFISDDIFIVYDLFVKMIIKEGSIKLSKFIKENNLEGLREEIQILIEKLIQGGQLEGQYLTEDMFLCFNNLTEPLKNLVKESIDDIAEGNTRKVVFDIGSVVESIVKERLILDIHEFDDVDKLPKYQEVIEAKELGRILRAAEDCKITFPANVELKSLNRFWAQKIKHTKPGELPYNPTIKEAREFLFEANRALNRLLEQKIPKDWKKKIAAKLLRD